MADTRRKTVLSYLGRVLGLPLGEEPSDAALLERFVRGGEEAAFAALLRRHGPMVWRVCRRALRSEHDAEDVYQATFLLLARKAALIRKQESVASWLHGVAYRLAVRARVQGTRRPGGEREAVDAHQKEPGLEVAWRELCDVLDAEVHALPPSYRAPLLLCYLEGLTQEEAARQLGWPLGTVRSRLARGRERLRLRLARRGLALSATALLGATAAGPAKAAPTLLFQPTLKAALQFAAGRGVASGISARAVALAEGGIKAMATSNAKLGVVLLLALGVAAAGLTGLAAQKSAPERPAQTAKEKPRADEKPAEDREARTDRLGDPLPAGASGRIGTERLQLRGYNFQSLFLSADGKLLGATDGDYVVHVWSLRDGKELCRWSDKDTPGNGVPPSFVLAFSSDDKTLAILSGTRIRFWNLAGNKSAGKVDAEKKDYLVACAFSPDGKRLAVIKRSGVIDLLEVSSGRKVRSFEGHAEFVSPKGAPGAFCVAFSHDGKRLASGGEDQTVRLWDVDAGKEVRKIEGHRDAVRAVAFSADGKLVASLSSDGTGRVWDAETGKEVRRFDRLRVFWSGPAAGSLCSLGFSADGKTLMAAGYGGLRVCDVATGKVVRTFRPGDDNVPQTAVAPPMAVSADATVTAQVQGMRVHVWDAASGDERCKPEGHEGAINAVAFSPDGKTLATGGGDGAIVLWDAVTHKKTRSLLGHSAAVGGLVFTPDGKHLISSASDFSDKRISVWEVSTGKEVRSLPGVPGFGPSGAVSPDGKYLAFVGGDFRAHVWDLAAGKHLYQLGVRPSSLAFSADGKALHYLDPRLGLHIADAATGEDLAPPKTVSRDKTPFLHSMAFSRDGRYVVTVYADRSISLWEVGSGRLARQLGKAMDPADQNRGWRAQFDRAAPAVSPNGKVVAVVGKSATVRLLEIATGKERAVFDGRQAGVQALAFSPDGRTLASASTDGTVLLWDVAGGPVAKAILSDKELDALWADLAGDDAVKGQRAIRRLTADPARSVPFLRKKLVPARPAEEKRIARLIIDLESDEFDTREKAAQELEKLGDAARPAMQQALKGKPSLDLTQRLQDLLGKLQSRPFTPDEVRWLRAVEALETLGTPEARQLFESLAKGAPGAFLTEEAQASLDRLARRKP